ncbi:MAG: RnfABCDGE type electron transport complex subunit D [Clostridiales bacterium]|nr:RnfABCDGE type electron transport complex subunit D [Clostridiales bacterium]MBQ4217443.1 RnfABCDGE type electron transport complex subunit D [Clostridiales bacterium]
MMNKTLAPFIHTEKNAPYIYLTIIAALVPACCYSIFYYGIRAMVMILICTLSFMTCDVLCSKVSRRDGNGEYFDISSVVSGLVFAMLLPPDTPVYMALAGVLFGSVVTKQVFGGAGSNIINPAAGARLFVEMVFPSGMCGYAEPREDWFGISSLISASEPVTPDYSDLSLIELVSGNFPGMLGASCAALAVLGAVFLLMRGNLRLYAPLSYIASLAVLYYIMHPAEDMLAFMLYSGSFFVAVFMLGDMTTIPSRFAAGAFAGLVCAVLTVVLIPHVSLGMALIAPVVTVNLMSFVMDFFSKTFSRRSKPSREVDVL